MKVSSEYLHIPEDTPVCFDTMGRVLRQGFTTPVTVRRLNGKLMVVKGRRLTRCAKAVSKALGRDVKVLVEVSQ